MAKFTTWGTEITLISSGSSVCFLAETFVVRVVRSLTTKEKVPGSVIPRPGRGLNFGRPYFATPFVDRDVKLLF